tara:strand:+ start:317 stop:673 length:357 start_codon:yes stop_codon:yes gene_type:complete
MDEGHKNLIMFYQTTLRNVGLYTTISFGALGYSRYYRGKSFYYNIILILTSLIFLSIAALMNYYLLLDMNHYVDLYKLDESIVDQISKWKSIPKIIIGLQGVLLVLGCLTLIKEITKK